MRSYAEANAYLAGGRNKDARSLTGRSTQLVRRDKETIAVQYHATDVVTYKADGRVILNSGGWKTVTTKCRINEYSPVSLTQTSGIWHVSPPGDHKAVVFRDGITWDGKRITNAARSERNEVNLRKQVREYAREYMAKLAAGEIPAPSGGDCWGCCMKATDGSYPLGRGGDHIRSHISKRERYFVPSLIQRAFEAMGAGKIRFWGLGSIWGLTPEAENLRQYATDKHARRMLTRFLYRELGLVA